MPITGPGFVGRPTAIEAKGDTKPGRCTDGDGLHTRDGGLCDRAWAGREEP